MSDRVGSGGSSDDADRKGKKIMTYDDEDQPASDSDDSDDDSDDSDSDDDDGEEPIEEFICQVDIPESSRLVIPYLSMFRHFPPLILNPGTVATLQLTDHLRRDWKVILEYEKDLTSYVITNGWSLYVQHYDLKPRDLIQFYLPVPQQHRNHFFIQHRKRFGKAVSLFDVVIPRCNRLPIPCEHAIDHFDPSEAPLPPHHLREYPLYLTDNINRTWEMRFSCFEDEQAYIICRGWEQYAAKFGLKHKDKIHFCQQDPAEKNRFIVYHDPRPEQESDHPSPDNIEPPDCLRENRLCELFLSESDVTLGRLEMSDVRIPFMCRQKEMVKLTDENSKDWYMTIVQVRKGYVITDGWDGIVTEHELEAGDIVRFYSPDGADHDKHFLIECANKKKKKKMVEKKTSGSGLGSRKVKRTKHSSPPPVVPPGLTPGDLSVFHLAYQLDGRGGSLEDFVKQQQQALQFQQKIHKSRKLIKPSEASVVVAEKGESKPVKELIFEHEISDANRFVIPYQKAARHFPPLVMYPDGEETLLFTDLLGHRDWEMTLAYDGKTHSYVITHGWNLYIQHYRLNPSDFIQVYLIEPQLHTNHFYIQHRKNCGQFLFGLLVPKSNRLSIPSFLAVKYFNPSKALPPPNHLLEYNLFLTDHLNITWKMKYICFTDEKTCVVVRGWEGYVAYYGLKHNDKVQFFERKPRLGKNSFIIYHESQPIIPASLSSDYMIRPLCLRENLLCELRLSKGDVEFGRLEMEDVELPFECRVKEMVKLTDEKRKDWYVIIVRPRTREYLILDGWEGIVKEHKLEVGDRVRFFMPASPDHGKHFLIECAKKKKKADKEEDGSDPAKPDDSPGLRQGGSRKGKEIAE